MSSAAGVIDHLHIAYDARAEVAEEEHEGLALPLVTADVGPISSVPLEPSLLIMSTSLLIRRTSVVLWRLERTDLRITRQRGYGSGNPGDPGFRTHAQYRPSRKLGVKWERGIDQAHHLLLTRESVRREVSCFMT
jgi:hypothetical protein